MKHRLFSGSLCLVLAGSFVTAFGQEEQVFIEKGAGRSVLEIGEKWTRGKGFLLCTGKDNYLFAGRRIGKGDFHIRLRMALVRFDRTAASFVLGGNHFGFDGGEGATLFIEGPHLGKTRFLGQAADFINPGEPFEFEAIRNGERLKFLINGKAVHEQAFTDEALGEFGLRPWRGTLRVYAFSAEGVFYAPPALTPLFVSGTGGYHTYRIPAILVTKKGTLLAFCEGRKNSRSDSGDIDTVLRRSENNGATWSDLRIVWDDGENTCGNPCPVLDRETGTVWLLGTWNRGDDHEGAIIAGTSKDTRRVFVARSLDDGLTFSQHQEITSTTKPAEWSWYATGPGVGIQLRLGPHKGRLVIPCDHKVKGDSVAYHSHVIISDDHGATWRLGGITDDGSNECQVIEQSDGTLLLNMRRARTRTAPYRIIATSRDGGMTWSESTLDKTLIGPRCQGCILRYTPSDAAGPSLLLFSNPAHTGARVRMTVRLSRDDGRTWTGAGLLHAGPSAYSCLARLPDGDMACLFEGGADHPYANIYYARFSLACLTNKKLPQESLVK